MKALEKSKRELIIEHDKLCDLHDQLLDDFNKMNFKNSKKSKLNLVIKLKQLEARIDVLSDAISSVDAKISLFKEMPKAGVDTSVSKNIASSDTIKKSLSSMKRVIDKEYGELDILATKKLLSHYFVDERRKGLKKYGLGFSSSMGGAFGMVAAILLSSMYQSAILPFVLIMFGACVGSIVSVLKVNKSLKIFKQLNEELGNNKLDMTSENGMQEVYDLSSKISKKSHDIMIMETIYKEQERSLEESLENESRNNSNNNLISLRSINQEKDLNVIHDKDDLEMKLSLRR